MYWFNGYEFICHNGSTNINTLLLTIVHCLQCILLYVFYSSLVFDKCILCTQPTRCPAEELESPVDLPCSTCPSLKTSLGTTDNYWTFYSLKGLHFPEYNIDGIIQYVSFLYWLFLLINICWSFSIYVYGLKLFFQGWIAFHHVEYHSFFNHSSAEGHLWWFLVFGNHELVCY